MSVTTWMENSKTNQRLLVMTYDVKDFEAKGFKVSEDQESEGRPAKSVPDMTAEPKAEAVTEPKAEAAAEPVVEDAPKASNKVIKKK